MRPKHVVGFAYAHRLYDATRVRCMPSNLETWKIPSAQNSKSGSPILYQLYVSPAAGCDMADGRHAVCACTAAVVFLATVIVTMVCRRCLSGSQQLPPQPRHFCAACSSRAFPTTPPQRPYSWGVGTERVVLVHQGTGPPHVTHRGVVSTVLTSVPTDSTTSGAATSPPLHRHDPTSSAPYGASGAPPAPADSSAAGPDLTFARNFPWSPRFPVDVLQNESIHPAHLSTVSPVGRGPVPAWLRPPCPAARPAAPSSLRAQPCLCPTSRYPHVLPTQHIFHGPSTAPHKRVCIRPATMRYTMKGGKNYTLVEVAGALLCRPSRVVAASLPSCSFVLPPIPVLFPLLLLPQAPHSTAPRRAGLPMAGAPRSAPSTARTRFVSQSG